MDVFGRAGRRTDSDWDFCIDGVHLRQVGLCRRGENSAESARTETAAALESGQWQPDKPSSIHIKVRFHMKAERKITGEHLQALVSPPTGTAPVAFWALQQRETRD
jgi:hypothetical protein